MFKKLDYGRIGLIIIFTISPLLYWNFLSFPLEARAHYYPDYPIVKIETILMSSSLTDQEKLIQLYYQTGLSPMISQKVLDSSPDPIQELTQFQEHFFYPIQVSCSNNSMISHEEYIDTPFQFADLQNGDILLTNASHTFNWRNGHAALVVDAKNGITLESVVIGENSCFQTLKKWSKFPNVVVLRLKNSDPEKLDELVTNAVTYLNNIPYQFSVGVFSSKEKAPLQTTGTQCAHLVWEAYKWEGYDIDSNGGLIVTPNDILYSDELEIIQVYGYSPFHFSP